MAFLATPPPKLVTDAWTAEVLTLVQGRATYAGMRLRLAVIIDSLAHRGVAS